MIIFKDDNIRDIKEHLEGKFLAGTTLCEYIDSNENRDNFVVIKYNKNGEIEYCDSCNSLQDFGVIFDTILGAPVCPECGSLNCYGIARVVGYFSVFQNWNRSKQAEFWERQKGNYWHDDD